MIMLNLTKDYIDGIAKRVSPILYTSTPVKMAKDWLLMYNELARLNKGLEEAVGDIKSFDYSKYSPDFAQGLQGGFSGAMFILRKHGLIEKEK